MKLGVSRGEPFESSSVVIQKVLTNAKGVWFQFKFSFFLLNLFLFYSFFIYLKLKRKKRLLFSLDNEQFSKS